MKKKTYEEVIKESPVTYELYANMIDDGNRYEISDGVLELMSPSPTFTHQSIIYEFQYKLNSDCRNEFIIVSSPIDVILSDTEVRQPDIVLIRRSRMSIISNRGINGAPDLVVEVTSEHSRRRDKVRKRIVYAKYGVPEYWIVDLSNLTLEQYVLDGDHYELIEVYAEDDPISSQTVPCASFSMNEIIQSLPVHPDQLE
ncbi:Uma2 family endonuclease [Cohnella sp. SGD-V74]|uniref:Uma2 family endonuclease n=1 Tax=unclassified Cohnella TaxID=2636738 RepID=UPI000D4F604E|nr:MULTISPECIES: Uma2 family endonuclease [unclassified Cohnella]PRX67923.1 Uma2 family endonuclease [Cohnella sp. SGD-V74]